MTELPIGTETRLPVGTLFKLEDGLSQWIKCVKGAIWITQMSEPRDIVLSAGESVTLAPPRAAIIGAINGAAVVWTDAGQDLSFAA